jgi:nucleoside-diphosphate-sugar epimerase
VTESLDRCPLVVLGASGFVGAHVLAGLASRWPGPVTAVARRPLADLPPGARLVQASLDDVDRVARAIPEHGIVVNLAYAASAGRDANLGLVRGLAEVCAATSAVRLVHLSTAMVAGRCEDRLVTEATPCRPVTEYQRTKLDIEHELRRRCGSRTVLVILRPTAVFGRGGQNLRKLARDLTSRPAYENYLRACLFGRRPMHLVPVETVVAAIEFAATAPGAAADGLYLVAADEATDNRFDVVAQVLRQALVPGRFALPAIPVPQAALPLVMRLAGRLSIDPRVRFSSERLRRAGFVTPTSFREALARYAADVAAESGRHPVT